MTWRRGQKRAEYGTPREHQVMQLLANGYTVKGAAEELGIAPSTAKTHVAHLLLKLDVDSSSEAIAVLMRRKLIK